jgi:hypothetical protein
MIFRRIILAVFFTFLLISCKREFACWCTAVVTVDDVTSTYKYKETIVSNTRKDGKKRCEKLARDTEYSEIECALYDY